MDIKNVLFTGIILGGLVMVVPWLVFTAIENLFKYSIRLDIWSIGSFWVLYFVARGKIAFPPRDKRMSNVKRRK